MDQPDHSVVPGEAANGVLKFISPRRHGVTDKEQEGTGGFQLNKLGAHIDTITIEILKQAPFLFFSVTPCLRGENASQILALRRRSELPITETELRLIAAAAKIGFRVM